MLEEPLADGAVHADVVADLLGLEPLVFEDLIEFVHDAQPKGLFGEGFGGLKFQLWGLGAGFFDDLLVLDQGGNGELEEFNDLGREVYLLGVVVGVGRRQSEWAAGDDVFAGKQREVLAAGNAELVGTDVNLAEERRGQGDADGG